MTCFNRLQPLTLENTNILPRDSDREYSNHIAAIADLRVLGLTDDQFIFIPLMLTATYFSTDSYDAYYEMVVFVICVI